MKHQPLLVKRVARLIAGTGTRQKRAARAAQDLADAGMLAWPAEADVNRLPYGLSVRATAMGVEVDAHLVVKALLSELATESVADPEGVAAELADIDAATGPERDALLDTVIERLGGAEVRYPTRQLAHRLVERLVRAAGPVVPAQREREAG